MKKLLLLVAGCALVFSLLGCETLKGIGKDIANTGDNIQDAVNGTHDSKI